MSNEKAVSSREWTEEEEQKLFIMRQDGLPYNIIGSVLGRSADSCSSKYTRTLWKEKSFYTKTDDIREQIYQNVKSDTREQMIQAGELKVEKHRIQSDILADAIAANVRALPEVVPPVYKRSDKKSKETHQSEDVGLILSDLHIGHQHTLEETGGLSEYNKDIFLQRVEILKANVADIVELHSYLYDLPNLHIFCLGDIVAGMNAVGQWSHCFIDTDIMTQWAEGVKSLADMVYYWLGLFQNVYFYGISGNHGRVSAKGLEKDTANWDSLSYKMLEQIFSDNSRVVFDIPNTWWIKSIIKSHKFLLVHGDDVRAGSMPIKGLKSFMEKWATITNFIPHYTLAGHFHSTAELTTPQGRLIINGSFIGPDLYSLKTIHSACRPEQKIFGIHDKRGITWSYNIDLREEKVQKS